jgi:superfamily II DNA or RNA helicase
MSEKEPLPELRYSKQFRQYQRSAIQKARRYRRAFRDMVSAGKSAPGAFLVCHPTGTGKTAVIAGLSQASPEIGNVLVLTTREAIRDQLTREIGGSIFIEHEKFNLGPKIRLAKNTYVVTESRILEGMAQELHEATSKLFAPDLQEFSTRQFERLVDDPKRTVFNELSENRSIILMTVQMLIGLDPRGACYKALLDHIDLIVFDEGHYEPAAKYSAAVRGLAKPIILLSATPFRNDLKPFKIEASNIHIYRFSEAVADKIIRNVEVIQRPSTADAETFCLDVIDFAEGKFGTDRSKWPRIIIHCEDMGSITRLGERFIANGFDAKLVAIHDRYSTKGDDHQPWQHRSVPPPKDTDAQIWIHQYKLMEGIDDHRFRILAFFDPLGNVRSVIQQVGRVIRLTPGESVQPAFVLDHFRGRISRSWDLFKSYDKSIDPEYLTKTMSKFYLEKFTSVQPKIDYISKKFRERLELNNINAADNEILFDRRVVFKRTTASDTLKSLAEQVAEELIVEDCEFKQYFFGKDTVLFVYAKVASPDFLNTLYFAEVRHGARLLILMPKYQMLAVAGAGSGAGSEGLGHLESIGPEKLECLVMPGQLGRISGVSSQNTNLGNRVVRRRTISAPSIAEVPPILDEHGHIVSTVTGYNGTVPRVVDDLDYGEFVDEEMNIVGVAPPVAANALASSSTDLIRRYIGIGSGRVSEQGPPLRLNAFRQWIDSLRNQMDTGSRYEAVYNRFAALSASAVTKGAARNLLLDIFDISDQYKHKDTGDLMSSDDLCVDRIGAPTTSDGKISSRFKITINGEPYSVSAVFNPASQHYRLESSALDEAFVSTGARKLPLCRTLNDLQSFSIIPDDISVIYVHGRFYAPGLKFGSRFTRAGFFVGHCLYPADKFKSISSEKGASVSNDNYDPASLFSLVDSWKNGFDSRELKLSSSWVTLFQPERVKFDPSLCICDDMSKESADFIFADASDRRVVLVHAKASKTFREFSASAVQEVCAQAQKNMQLFSTYSLQKPGNFSLWNRAHKFSGDNKVKLTVQKRFRKPVSETAAGAWTTLNELLQNPLTTREIWLVLGNMLSAKTFYDSLLSDKPAPETLQLNHLLQTTIAAAGSVGAKTRIFCAP